MGIIAWILLGLFAGAIARAVIPGRTEPGGCIGTTAVGILGALLGGFLASALHIGHIHDFFNLGTMLLIKKGNPEHVESLETLCGKTVSTVQGSTQIKLVDDASANCKAEGKPAIENLQYAQPSDARMIEGFPARWLGVVSWLRRVSDRWEAAPR